MHQTLRIPHIAILRRLERELLPFRAENLAMKVVLLFLTVAWSPLICCAAEEEAASQPADQGIAVLLRSMLAGEPLPADVVYVHVSERALQKLLSRPIVREAAVRETIVGTPVRGVAKTTGQIGVRLVPAKDRAVVDLLFSGRVQARTTGFGGPVRVHSLSITRFSAVKRLRLGEQGIEVLPTQVAARTWIRTDGVTTNLPRLRGRIARRIGGGRAAESRPAAEAETARKCEVQIGHRFDREVADQSLSARSELSQLLAALQNERDLLRGRLKFSTSDGHLQLAIQRADGERATPPPLPETFGSPDIAIHVHSTLVKRLVRSTILEGQANPLMTALQGDKAPQRYVSVVGGEPGTQLKQSADGQWWSLVIPTVPTR